MIMMISKTRPHSPSHVGTQCPIMRREKGPVMHASPMRTMKGMIIPVRCKIKRTVASVWITITCVIAFSILIIPVVEVNIFLFRAFVAFILGRLAPGVLQLSITTGYEDGRDG